MEVRHAAIADAVPPAERWDLSLRVTVIGRNLVSLYLSPLGKASCKASP
jgi:hypothetical protein